MENGYRKSLNIRFHLDPRTKLLLLILFSVVVMIDVTDGPAYIVRAIMTYIPVVLVCLEGKPHVGARFTVLFILATWLMEITQENIGGIAGMLILFLCYMITQFAPTMIMVWYCNYHIIFAMEPNLTNICPFYRGSKTSGDCRR